MESTPDDAIALGQLIHDIAHALVAENVEDLLDVGISFDHVSLLLWIQEMEDPAMSELGHATGIQQSTLTRMVDRLVSLEYAERKSDPTDRRVVRVSLTPTGAEALEKFSAAFNKRMQSVLRHVTADERRQLLGCLRKVHDRLFEQREKGT